MQRWTRSISTCTLYEFWKSSKSRVSSRWPIANVKAMEQSIGLPHLLWLFTFSDVKLWRGKLDSLSHSVSVKSPLYQPHISKRWFFSVQDVFFFLQNKKIKLGTKVPFSTCFNCVGISLFAWIKHASQVSICKVTLNIGCKHIRVMLTGFDWLVIIILYHKISLFPLLLPTSPTNNVPNELKFQHLTYTVILTFSDIEMFRKNFMLYGRSTLYGVKLVQTVNTGIGPTIWLGTERWSVRSRAKTSIG